MSEDLTKIKKISPRLAVGLWLSPCLIIVLFLSTLEPLIDPSGLFGLVLVLFWPITFLIYIGALVCFCILPFGIYDFFVARRLKKNPQLTLDSHRKSNYIASFILLSIVAFIDAVWLGYVASSILIGHSSDTYSLLTGLCLIILFNVLFFPMAIRGIQHARGQERNDLREV